MERLITKAIDLFNQSIVHLDDEFNGDYGELVNYVANVLSTSYDEYMTMWSYFNRYFQWCPNEGWVIA